jgi:hypothetical protein
LTEPGSEDQNLFERKDAKQQRTQSKEQRQEKRKLDKAIGEDAE